MWIYKYKYIIYILKVFKLFKVSQIWDIMYIMYISNLRYFNNIIFKFNSLITFQIAEFSIHQMISSLKKRLC